MQRLSLFYLKDEDKFPNSPLPAILYRNVLQLPIFFKGRYVRQLFARHQWTNAWEGGVFTYAHYHSTTHEVLGFLQGSTILQLGGDNGDHVKVANGDVLIIPAGVAHKNLGREDQVKCIGAYPDGRDYDIKRGWQGERPGADRLIESLPVPLQDPFYGSGEGLRWLWISC